MKATPLKDISRLQGLRLKSLDLFRNTSLTSLKALKGMSLETLIVSGAKLVTTVAPLEGMSLTYLDLASTSVKDLDTLHGMPFESEPTGVSIIAVSAIGPNTVNYGPLSK